MTSVSSVLDHVQVDVILDSLLSSRRSPCR